MKIVQSFWSKPYLTSECAKESDRFGGGWMDPKYNLMSWAYSAAQLRKFYDQVELVTDSFGQKLLIERLGLPYTSCRVVLDDINHYSPRLWALGKMIAMSIQDEPFIHIDGDAYIWQRFDDRLNEAEIVVQNAEFGFPFYEEVFATLLASQFRFPAVIEQNYQKQKCIHAYCAGILGGVNISFIKRYTQQAIAFVNANLDRLKFIDIGRFNTIFEQHLLFCLTEKENIKVCCYSDKRSCEDLDAQFKSLDRFVVAPDGVQFMHLFGEDAKKNPAFCNELASKLADAYPEYHERVLLLTNSPLLVDLA